MSDYCLICECEPIDDSEWYRCEKSTEMICPWCVKEMRQNKEIVERLKKRHDQLRNHPRDCYPDNDNDGILIAEELEELLAGTKEVE